MSAMSLEIEVFCSYAHEDEAWLRKLENHLSLLIVISPHPLKCFRHATIYPLIAQFWNTELSK
jgi:hypothetical protein